MPTNLYAILWSCEVYRARSAIGSGGPRLISYTHALFIVPPLHIMLVIEHFTPRLIQALQKAVNYLFTGRNDPQDAPEILDRKSCVVVVPDPKSKHH
jgi:hypothetical protein